MSDEIVYPNEFLGRCATCLDNAYLSSEPCKHGYGNGMPCGHDRCLIEIGRERYREEMECKKP